MSCQKEIYLIINNLAKIKVSVFGHLYSFVDTIFYSSCSASAGSTFMAFLAGKYMPSETIKAISNSVDKKQPIKRGTDVSINV